MKILLDMNIPIIWESFLHDAGHQALHWSNIGDIRAADIDIKTLDNIATELQAGVLVTIDPRKNRARLLPLKG